MSGRKGQRQFGSVRKLPSGGWQARYKDRRGESHSRTFRTKGNASAFLAETQADLNRGVWRNPRDAQIPFSDFAEMWLKSNPSKAASTVARDSAILNRHLNPVVGHLPLIDITPADVQAVINGMESRPLKPKTVRTNAGVLAAILNAAVLEDRLYASPYRRPKMKPMIASEKRRLTLGEQRLLAIAMRTEYRITIPLAGVLGLRFSEVVGLRVGDIDFLARPVVLRVERPLVEVNGHHVASVGKTRGSRARLTVPPFVVTMLSEHLALVGRQDPEDLVVTAPGGGPVRAANFRNRVWAPAVEVAGFTGLTYHGLRHSAAGIMRQAGASDQVVQHRLRHTHRATSTDIYGWTPDAMDSQLIHNIEALWAEDGTKMARRQPPAARSGA